MVLASTSAMRTEVNGLHARIDDVREELTAKVEDVRKHLTDKIEDVRKEIGAQIAGLDSRVRVVAQSMEATRVGVPDLTSARARTRGTCTPTSASRTSTVDQRGRPVCANWMRVRGSRRKPQVRHGSIRQG